MISLAVQWRFEVVRIQPPTHSCLIIRLQNLILDIKAILFLEMVEYHPGEEASNSCSDDAHFESSLLWDLVITKQSICNGYQFVPTFRARLRHMSMRCSTSNLERFPYKTSDTLLDLLKLFPQGNAGPSTKQREIIIRLVSEMICCLRHIGDKDFRRQVCKIDPSEDGRLTRDQVQIMIADWLEKAEGSLQLSVPPYISHWVYGFCAA